MRANCRDCGQKPATGSDMGRLSAVFIAVCMVLVAASIGAVAFLSFGFTGMEASVVTIAVLTALVMVNSLTTRQRDRYDVGSQIADLSRGTADIGRQVSELDRRMVALEQDVVAAIRKNQAATEPLAAEISELGELLKELADAVAAHEQILENAIVDEPAARTEPAHAPQPIERADVADRAELGEPERADGPATSGHFKGLEQSQITVRIARAVEANRLDLFLQPIVTLPQRKVRYYEALTRLRDDDGTLLAPEDFLGYAENGGLMPAIDNLMVFRCVQVVRRLSNKNREVGLFCNISSSTLTHGTTFQQIVDFLEANRTLAPFIVFQFSQFAVRALGPIEQECIATLADLGFRFSMDHMSDLRVEPKELAERGFRFVKAPASLLLNRTAAPGTDIHPADFSDLLGRYGIDLIAEKIEREGTVVDLLDYDVRFGQGTLFSPPRPVRSEVLQGIADKGERPPAPRTERTAPSQRPGPPAERAPEVRIEPRDAGPPMPGTPGTPGDRRAGAIAQLARGLVRRA
jgi:cyclic-di-GMP phosphodiesterase TipF (flagellum assembly factor)